MKQIELYRIESHKLEMRTQDDAVIHKVSIVVKNIRTGERKFYMCEGDRDKVLPIAAMLTRGMADEMEYEESLLREYMEVGQDRFKKADNCICRRCKERKE